MFPWHQILLAHTTDHGAATTRVFSLFQFY